MVKYLRLLVILFMGMSLQSCRDALSDPSNNMSSVGKAVEEPCGFVQNSYGARVSWKKNIPVTVEVDPEFSAEFFNAATLAADQWNTSAGKKLIELEKVSFDKLNDPGRDQTSRLYWRTDWPKENSNQQALTVLFFSANEIREADVKVNAKDFNFYATAPNSNREIHMKSLLVHEFGHLLGLRHSSAWPTVMWATLAPTTVRETISEKDLASLKCEY
ncbi:MAG: matrixin family metalloprotease [Bdellovibrionota bacterium]